MGGDGVTSTRLPAVSLVVLLAAALLPSPRSAAQTAEIPPTPDHATAYSITPPGQDGTTTLPEFLLGSGPHFDDQLEMYAALVEDDDVTDGELLDYFHPMQFGPGEEIEDSYEPTEGVTVHRDNFGVPHIYADSMDNASFALGYVTAEDRLFQMDVFRHAARGTLAEFVGPGEDDSLLQRDIETRREGYTDAEMQEQLDDLDDKFGEVGANLQTGLQAYADGVNAYIDEIMFDPTARPFEYDATGNFATEDPEPWSPLDTLHVVVLQLRVFGETAGGEIENAGFYRHLVTKHGPKRGRALYDDFLFQNDPNSPTTIQRKDADFSTENLGKVDWSSVAIPDQAEEMAEEMQRERIERESFLSSLGFTKQASNALLVSPEESATGNPLLLGGPQVGHALPSFFLDVDVHAPGVDFRGPAVPGTSALIPLGRGPDYAWSLTTGFSDAVDVRVELLCDPGGGDPTMESNAYVSKGECLEMESREETFQVNHPPTAPGPPRSETHTFYRTVHGPVFERGKVDGKPVAFVKERFFWMKEVDSLPSFYKWNLQIDSIEDFAAAAEDFTMSFNAFYADHEHIGYFHVGSYPKREAGVHPSLPIWGTGEWEWKGQRSYEEQPKIVDPDTGWVANWNNKPAKGWDSQDGFKWGSVQRVQLLQDRMQELLDGPGKAALSDIVDVIRDAATRDARGVYVGPAMLRTAGAVEDPNEDFVQAVDLVDKWVEAGAHRKNSDRDETMDDGPALAIFDTWYERLVHRIFDDELGTEGYDLMADAPISDFSTLGSSFWFGFDSYLRNLFDEKRRSRAFSADHCNDITSKATETCADQAIAALTEALAFLKQDQGDDMSAWTTDAENLDFTNNPNSTTAGSVDDIPWQNRGSENHIVEIISDAP